MSNQISHCPRCAGNDADAAHLFDDGDSPACEECDGYGVAAMAMNARPYVSIRAKKRAGMLAKARAWVRAKFNRDAHAIRADKTRTVGQRMYLGLAVRPHHLKQKDL